MRLIQYCSSHSTLSYASQRIKLWYWLPRLSRQQKSELDATSEQLLCPVFGKSKVTGRCKDREHEVCCGFCVNCLQILQATLAPQVWRSQQLLLWAQLSQVCVCVKNIDCFLFWWSAILYTSYSHSHRKRKKEERKRQRQR